MALQPNVTTNNPLLAIFTQRMRNEGQWFDRHFTIFQQIRNEGKLFDGILRTDDGVEFPIHRCVLVLSSDYFCDLFWGLPGYKGGTEPKPVYEIPQVPADKLQCVLEYCYTHRLEVDSDNVAELLATAGHFQVSGMSAICWKFLEDGLCNANCIAVMHLASAYGCAALENTARRYLVWNFQKVCRTEHADFLALKAEELFALLMDDELGIRTELHAVDAIVAWISSDPTERWPAFGHLMRAVHLGLVNGDEVRYRIRRILEPPYAEAHLNAILQHILMETPLQTYRPRVPHDVLFAIGGWAAGSPTTCIETYDVRADRWSICPQNDNMPRAYHQVELLAGLLYLVGGFDGTRYYNSVRCFNPVTMEWMNRAPMYQCRCYVSTCVLGGRLYAIGGYDGQTRLDTVERYDPETNGWMKVNQMNKQRSDASAAPLKGRIYIAGGFTGQEVLNSAEFYDPDSNMWTLVARMRVPRSGISMVSFRNHLYVLGGFNGAERLQSVERYDPFFDHWSAVPDMLLPRSNFTAVILEEQVYAIGGYNGSATTNLAERYDPSTDEWNPISAMIVNRSALCACVFPNLINARDYSYLKYSGS